MVYFIVVRSLTNKVPDNDVVGLQYNIYLSDTNLFAFDTKTVRF